MMLACPTPMFLAWGPELRCFYNDAYRPILGYRVDTALGRPFRAVWSEVWDELEPLIVRTLAGESCELTDMQLDLRRQGVPEESWWTFSYSPVFDDAGAIAGFLAVSRETTARVLAERERKAADERRELALSLGNSIGMWDWDVTADRVVTGARFAAFYGVDPEAARRGVSMAEFVGRVHPEDREYLDRQVTAAIAQHGSFAAEYRLLEEDGTVRWLAAQGSCFVDEASGHTRFPGVTHDITGRMESEQALRAAQEERDFVIDLTARQLDADPSMIVQMALDGLGERLRVDLAGCYHIVGPDRMRFDTCWSGGTLTPLLGEHPLSAFGERGERQLRRGEPLVFQDSQRNHNGALTALAAGGIRAGLFVPLLDAGAWRAGVYLFHAQVRSWTMAEIALVTQVAEMSWRAVKRAEVAAHS